MTYDLFGESAARGEPPEHRKREELEAALPEIRAAPRDDGVLRMIVRRPRVNQREVIAEGRLDLVEGLVGDSWAKRGSSRSADGRAHPEMQLNLMNVRVTALVAREEARWALAGDQLLVDLDLSYANLPPGSRVAVGDAVIEITDQPHTGCAKFRDRFGLDALGFVNSPVGRELNLRGVCARVVKGGAIRAGDRVRKVGAAGSASRSSVEGANGVHRSAAAPAMLADN